MDCISQAPPSLLAPPPPPLRSRPLHLTQGCAARLGSAPLGSAPARLPSGPVRPGHAQCGRSGPGPGSARAGAGGRARRVQEEPSGFAVGEGAGRAGAAAVERPGRCRLAEPRPLEPRRRRAAGALRGRGGEGVRGKRGPERGTAWF